MIEYLGDFPESNIFHVSLVIWYSKARLSPRASEASAYKGRVHKGNLGFPIVDSRYPTDFPTANKCVFF